MLSPNTKSDLLRMKDEILGVGSYVHLPRSAAKEFLKEYARLANVEEVIEKAASEVAFALEVRDLEPDEVKKRVQEFLVVLRKEKRSE